MADRLLLRLFLQRFLEHDLVSTNADRREVLSIAGGVLVGLSVCIALLVSIKYQFDNVMPPGTTSIWSLDDRFLFVSASMLVMALLAVALWDGLSIEARDVAVLGPLPVPAVALVRAKLCAVALLAAAVDLAWNLPATIMRVVAVPTGLHVGMRGVLTLTLAHGAVTLAAGAFGFIAVLALREALTATLGRRGFAAIAPAVQATIAVVLTAALLLLPGAESNAARTWMAPGSAASRLLPPVWFTGLHESVAGEVVDSLPRVQPARPFTAAERRATALYRSVRPTFPALARRALVAFAALFGVFAAAAVWNARRLPAPDVRRPGRWRPLRYPATWTSRAIAPTPLQQAGFWLALQTIVRRPHARAALTTAFAGGLAVVVVAVRDRALTVQADPASIPLPLLAAQMLLLGSVLIGFRRAAHVPADLRASVAFRVAWDGRLQPFVGGIKRAAMISLATPLLAVLFAWHAAVFGPRVAGQHLAAGAAFCGLLLNVLFARYRRVPFVSPAASGDEPASRYAAYAVAIPLASFIVAWLERVTLESPPAFAALLAVLVGFAQAVAIADRLTAASGPLFEFDDTPVLPTQRLDLAG